MRREIEEYRCTVQRLQSEIEILRKQKMQLEKDWEEALITLEEMKTQVTELQKKSLAWDKDEISKLQLIISGMKTTVDRLTKENIECSSSSSSASTKFTRSRSFIKF